jgi:hypothetical protein
VSFCLLCHRAALTAGVKGLLVRNLGHLRPEQFAKLMDTLGGDRHGQ